ncbi:MAG: anti-virulence regulator CigR family protein [Pseudomonadota bacterium]
MCSRILGFSRFLRRVAVLAAIFLIGPPLAAAPPEGKGQAAPHLSKPGGGREEGHASHGKADPAESGRSGPPSQARIDRDQIRRLVVTHHLAGHVPLPPGIRHNLVRGKPLPPGIARRAVPAPILAVLPRYPGMNGSSAAPISS